MTSLGAIPASERAARASGARAPRPELLAIAGVSTVIVVIVLWAHGGGANDLATPGSAISSFGRLTGLVSADLLLIQVLLMARIPWIERASGQVELARWHRLTGFTSFHLMLTHIVFITIGYAVSDRAGLLSEAWLLVTTYPGMLLATAATGMLVLVVVTSIRAARRRLRYESWHLLHLYAYLGVGLAIPHELWTGTDFVGSPLATAYWWTAYGLAAGSVLLFRLVVPLWRSARHQVRVHSVVPESDGVVSIWLRGKQLDRLRARAGQFFQWRFLSGSGWSRAHPYSLSAAARSNFLRITVKDLGDGSAYLRRLRPGTRVLFEGPYGALTHAVRRRQRLTLIACGIGITPLRALLEELPFRKGEATLIYRAATDRDFTFRKELEHLAARRGIRLCYLPGPRAGSARWVPAGMAADHVVLGQLVPDLADHDVFVCGPPSWMDAVVRAADTLGVPREQVHVERFDW